ncbi:MAG TPA: response regulator [Vicinamibacterales bacterium]|nr:response regulator [Vicinamibacterales bacterium]
MTQSQGRAAPLRILVADDSRVNRHHATGLLTPRGHDVVAVETGQQAVAAARNGRFDVILMDVEMPDMDGLQAAVEIRQAEQGTSRRVPIVAVTSRDMASDLEACRAAGMDALLVKPLEVSALLPLIDQLVGASAAVSSPVAPVEPAFDSEEFLARLGGDEALAVEMIEIFAAESAGMLSTLRAAVDANDANAVQRAAHNLKGSVSVFGGRPATRAALSLEGMGRDGSLASGRAAMATLEGEVHRLNRALQSYLKDRAS